MEEQWVMDRQRLWSLHQAEPEWGKRRLAQALGRSLRWVKKWFKRLQGVDLSDETIWFSRSRARHTSPKQVTKPVEEAILAIRDEPPEGLGRIPGPKAILYYLDKDPDLKEKRLYLPRSTRTIWQILRKYGRIFRRSRPEPEPEERPAPMQAWSIDFKDISSVPPEPEGKQQHGVECFNVVDDGTSILLSAQVRADYTAETVIEALMFTLQAYGRPRAIRFDRDPRFIGSWSAQEFPSAFMKLLMCLDIEPRICPPQRPDKNPFVERYHRNYKYECLRRQQPTTLAQAQAVTLVYQRHYNQQRPNQAITCGNQPPRVAFPDLPPLPPLPQQVNPDRWLAKIHGKFYKRRIQPNGSVQIGKQYYYIRQRLKGQQVLLQVDAPAGQLKVLLDNKLIKRLNLKGLYEGVISLDKYVALARQEALSDWRRYLRRRPYRR